MQCGANWWASNDVLNENFNDFTVNTEVGVNQVVVDDTSTQESVHFGPTGEHIFSFIAPESASYTFSTCGST